MFINVIKVEKKLCNLSVVQATSILSQYPHKISTCINYLLTCKNCKQIPKN